MKTDSDRNAFFSKEDSGGNPFFMCLFGVPGQSSGSGPYWFAPTSPFLK